jgi:hypothetical protein
MVGEAIEQRGGHLGVAKDARPFAEGEGRRHDDRGALVEAADQVKQEPFEIEAGTAWNPSNGPA